MVEKLTGAKLEAENSLIYQVGRLKTANCTSNLSLIPLSKHSDLWLALP